MTQRTTWCDDRAQHCDDLAAEALDPRLAAEWRLMAREWRAAGLDEVNDNDAAYEGVGRPAGD